ncbi:MBL fold metallo-hydrolase [Actinokineospora iranica]|uniref:Ribonuclease BN, tRNA processing enzyme n=1 Tax=Actinokineospora iranica TaxID=1271860 RepID=A0A1G6U0G5_9PSEU|nr:MBL fold metallo-hydrolase [Actinokineospora iranica]SDD34829.1 Ribonuclease BN, tRNA processing enzyme [Actinokineospora iranica]
MQLTILGCRSGSPADGQASSGYLVETGRTRLLLDCGPGIATALSGVVEPEALDAVVISHFHTDHCYDLLPIGKAMLSRLVRFPGGPEHADREFRPVPLFVPEGARELFAKWAALFPVASLPLLDQAFEVAFDVREYQPGDQFEVGDCTLGMHGLRHIRPNCGARVESAEGTLAYTGDTGVTDAAVKLAADADLLLAEATLSATDETDHGHLSGGDAGRLAARANVGELVLTHFASTESAWLRALHEDAASAFAGPVRLATPGRRLPVGKRAVV